MQYIHKYASSVSKVFILVAFFASPLFFVFAQETTVLAQNEGSSESWEVRMQRIREYRRQSTELEQKINTLGNTAVVSIPIPVLFGVELKNISPNFGDPRSGGRTHEGEDIMVVKGTPIVSPTPAVVLRTGVGPSEGLYVYTANPGGETFVYMHLDRIGEGVVSGQILETGSLIGYVGNTGNASAGAAHLHFEIQANGTALDPFPRLTKEFSASEKITYLNKIFTQTTDSSALAQFLVTNFKSTFTTAASNGVLMPPLISNYLLATQTPVPSGSGTVGASSDLTVGSTGIEVKNLQLFLIARASGPAAIKLASTGATGTFGSLTEAALAEYQKSVGISPAIGYYGPITRKAVLAASGTQTPSPVTGTITRTLKVGSTGNDVKILQTRLGISADGNFGPHTKTAVIAFQASKGLTADGIVGPASRAALGF